MNRIIFILVVMIFLSTNIVNAEPINYTFTGTATGSVDSAFFSNAEVTFTVFADTENVLFYAYAVPGIERVHLQEGLAIAADTLVEFGGGQTEFIDVY